MLVQPRQAEISLLSETTAFCSLNYRTTLYYFYIFSPSVQVTDYLFLWNIPLEITLCCVTKLTFTHFFFLVSDKQKPVC